MIRAAMSAVCRSLPDRRRVVAARPSQPRRLTVTGRAASNGSSGATVIRRPGYMTGMANELNGKRIAFLVSNEGVEQVELTSPWQAVRDAGGQPVLVAPKAGEVQAFNHLDKGDVFEATVPTSELAVADYDGVVLPGGVANSDQLRTDEPAVRFLQQWTSTGHPVAAICHGPWTLVEADAVKGKTLTSWPSLQTDIRNAGGQWRDEQVVRSSEAGYGLATSRKPDDLEAFNEAIVELFSR
jgi:protease I